METITYVKLIKVAENEYIPERGFNAHRRIDKDVVIEGERYTNTHYEDYYFDCRGDFDSHKDRWHNYHIDFSEFGVPLVTMWDRRGFYGGIYPIIYEQYSENTHVNIIMLAYGLGVINKKIISGVYTCNKNYDKTSPVNNLLKSNMIELTYFDYGFNNAVKFEISLKKFLCLDFNKLSDQTKNELKAEYMGVGLYNNREKVLPEYILKCGLLTDKQKIDIATDILKLKIKYKQKTNFYERTS